MTPTRPHGCDTAIVGAGAAGLATAIFTRRLNPARSVWLLDGAKKPGAKILMSGGSRCNVTNASVTDADFWGGKRSIVRRVLRAFPVPDTIAFFEQIGVRLHEETGGKLFPDSNRARHKHERPLRPKFHSRGRWCRAVRHPDCGIWQRCRHHKWTIRTHHVSGQYPTPHPRDVKCFPMTIGTEV